MHDNTLTAENLNNLTDIAKLYNQDVKFWNVEKLCANEIEDLRNRLNETQKEMYSVGSVYRFLIPTLFSDIDKVIYLDSDIIVNLDIKELYDIDLTGKPLAAVAEIEVDAGHHIAEPMHYLRYTGIVKSEDYFNSGVLSINLDYLRENYKTLTDGIKFVSEHPKCNYFDQDVLNYCYSKNYIKLPEKFDVFVHTERRRRKGEPTRQAIYHYCVQSLKLDTSDNLNQLWFNYFAKTPWFNEKIIGHIFQGVRVLYIEQKNFAVQISAIMSGKERAFFITPDNVEISKQIFAISKKEELIVADTDESINKLVKSLKKSKGKKIFFILANYPAVHKILTQLGFVEGKDFINAILFLSDAHGVPFNSHSLVKLL